MHIIDMLCHYYFVGGMPECVEYFAKTRNVKEIRKIQEEIIKSYIADFTKHAPATEIPKLTQIWDSIPKHLARENKKFVFQPLEKEPVRQVSAGNPDEQRFTD
ncbi:MAG: hypothetical protein GXP53_11340 [Deltaproteobacteria bacterium]|nr:hypothetical protein [Deltaproteobacteria bacterium]